MKVYPQVLINVRGVDRDGAGSDEVLTDAVAAVDAELGDSGRVLLRASGTEPLVRVMVEASDAESRRRWPTGLAGVVRERLAL